MHAQSLAVRFFSKQFWQGELYPRWLQDMFAGDGSPIFFYYPPLAYFITAFFCFLSPLDAFGYISIAASVLLAVILSSIAFYAWIQEETGDSRKALIGGLLFVSAPNHIAQFFYHTLLFSSTWAYVFVPLLMLFARRIAMAQPHGIAGFALSLGLLVMSNLPMTIMFAPIAVLYGILHFSRQHFAVQSGRLMLSCLLGFGLSAIYLLPALLYIHFANVTMHWNVMGKDTYDLSYFFMGFDHTDSHWLTAYWASVLVLLLAYYWVARREKRSLFFLLIACAALLLMLPASKVLWDHIVPLRALQMAERLFAVSSLCIAALAAFSLPRLRTLAYALIAVYTLLTLAIALNTRTTLAAFKASQPAQYDYYALNIDQYPFYLTSPDLIANYDKAGVAALKSNPRPQLQTIRGTAAAEITLWAPRGITFHYHATEASVVRVRQFDFPGFRAFDGDNELKISRDTTTGEILLNLPAGEGDVTLRLTALWQEALGREISILCALTALLLTLFTLRRKTAVYNP